MTWAEGDTAIGRCSSAIKGNIRSIGVYSNIKLRFIKFTFIKRALKWWLTTNLNVKFNRGL